MKSTNHPSNSSAQKSIEEPVRAALADEFGRLQPGSKQLTPTARADFDGVSLNGTTVVEIFAHVGKLKGGQIQKVAKDAFKITTFLNAGLAKIGVLAFIDADAASTALNEKSWLGAAIAAAGIHVRVVDIDADRIESVIAAQADQHMTNG